MKRKKSELYFDRENPGFLESMRDFNIDNFFIHLDEINRIHPTLFPTKIEPTVKQCYAICQLPRDNERIGNFIDYYKKIYERLETVWRGRIDSARKKNIPYEEDAFYTLTIPKVCPIINLKIDWINKKIGGADDAPSIDKIIPARGYIKGNIRIISFAGNKYLSNLLDHPDRIRPLRNYLNTLIKE